MIKGRERERTAKSKESGVYKGSKKTVDDTAMRMAMQAEGASFRKVTKALNVSLSSVQRAMRAQIQKSESPLNFV